MINKEQVRIEYRDYINSIEDGLNEDGTYIIDDVAFSDVIKEEADDLGCLIDDETIDIIIGVLGDEGYIKGW